MSWSERAACKLDKKFLSFDFETVKECKKICESCPVQMECLSYCLEVDGHWVAAGTSRYDRLLLTIERVE